jgi:hypothetical protein
MSANMGVSFDQDIATSLGEACRFGKGWASIGSMGGCSVQGRVSYALLRKIMETQLLWQLLHDAKKKLRKHVRQR